METDAALLWGFLFLILLVIATVIGILIHSGLLNAVEVKTCKPDIGEIKIAYKFARGPYKESGMLFTQVHTLLPQYRTVGVYYDDPKKRQPHKLRYIVGIIVSENGSETPQEHISLLEEHGYHFATFPAIDHAVQTRFPFKSTISIIVAIMKVYPAIREYIEHRSLCARPFLEVYDNKKSEIIFVGPLARQDDFYVPEVQQEEDEDNREDDYDDDRTENSSRSWDESASFIRGQEVNDSECSESVGGDDSSSFARPHPPPPVNPSASAELSSPQQLPQASAQLEPANIAEAAASPSAVPSPPAEVATPLAAAAAAATPAPTSYAGAEAANPAAPIVAPLAVDPIDSIPVVDVGETVESGSLGGTESDANTASSFEEIDEKEAASIPEVDVMNGARGPSMRKDEDEGER